MVKKFTSSIDMSGVKNVMDSRINVIEQEIKSQYRFYKYAGYIAVGLIVLGLVAFIGLMVTGIVALV